MKKISALLLSLCASAAACACLALPVSAEGSVEDVYAALRGIGFPESMIQEAKTQYQSTPHDENGMTIEGNYYPYDVLADMVELYEDQIWDKVGEQFGVSGAEIRRSMQQQPAVTGTSADSNTPAETTQTTPAPVQVSVQTQVPFVNMTLEEKQDYVASLPEAERAPFLASLTTRERNSVIRQMDTNSQAEIADSFIGLGEQLGMHVTVDHIGDGRIDYSVRNGQGTLIDVSTVGTSVDDTGWDTTLPVLGGGGMIFGALGGLAVLTRRSRKEQDELQEAMS